MISALGCIVKRRIEHPTTVSLWTTWLPRACPESQGPFIRYSICQSLEAEPGEPVPIIVSPFISHSKTKPSV